MITNVIKVAEINENTRAEIAKAADVITSGGLVIFPTETVYGLGADATNADAVKKIYVAKGRPSDNPLIIHIANPEEAEAYTYTVPLYYKLAERFMPGPLTVILKSKDTIPHATRGGLDTVAVRCPSSIIARTLIECAGVPIAAPSANLSGTPSPTSAKHVIDDMMGRVDVIIASDDSEIGLESTIVKIEDDNTLTLLRPGKITVDDLLTVVDVVKIADSVTDKLAEGAVALSPGMKYKHYAPKAPLMLVDCPESKYEEFIKENNANTVAVLAYTEQLDRIHSAAPDVYCFDFGSKDDEADQAARLFSILRETDKQSFTAIYAPLPKTSGMGLALYNRMIRAAAHRIVRL